MLGKWGWGHIGAVVECIAAETLVAGMAGSKLGRPGHVGLRDDDMRVISSHEKNSGIEMGELSE